MVYEERWCCGNRLQSPNTFDILIQTLERPDRLRVYLYGIGGSSSSSGSATTRSHPLSNFGGILAGRADYHNSFDRSFSSTAPMDMVSMLQAAFMGGSALAWKVHVPMRTNTSPTQHVPRGYDWASSLKFE